MKKKSYGFLLVEILIVLSLTLIIITIAVPSLQFLNHQLVAANVEKLSMAFAYMQQSAIASNKNLVLKFEQPNSYSYQNFREKLSNNVEFGTKQSVKGAPAYPSKNLETPITFLKNQVTFYSNGQIQPGSAYLIDSSKQYFYALTVPISQISYIRKYKFFGNKWILI